MRIAEATTTANRGGIKNNSARIVESTARLTCLDLSGFLGAVSDIWLFVNAFSDGTPSDQPESFSFGQPEASKLYRYIFDYNPPLWKEIELPFGGGGHEGFLDHKFCFGDGVAITFITYMLGQENIRLFYDPICESDGD